MSIDKHDLFRNAIPGFVFLVVILSFYATNESLDRISNGQGALLGLIAGLPLGFIIQNMYRCLHVWFEQKTIDKKESALVDDKKINGTLREKASYLWFQISKSTHKAWKERIDFLYSYMHALGASALAIGLAIIVMWVVKYHFDWTPIVRYTMGIWVVIAGIFCLLRERVKENCWISTKILFLEDKTTSLSEPPK